MSCLEVQLLCINSVNYINMRVIFYYKIERILAYVLLKGRKKNVGELFFIIKFNAFLFMFY